jgi:putative ABC transport system permease protein
MSSWRLVVREILYRKLSFALAVLAVAVAVGCLVAVLTLLEDFDRGTEQVIARKETETQARTAQLEVDTRRRAAKLEDDYRKITLHLGFNLLILPRDQSPAELHLGGLPTKTMPEDYADRLTKSPIASINHVLPVLQQEVPWPERQRTIILVGTRGEVPILNHRPKKPLLEQVPPGTMVVGHALHSSLKLAVGDKVRLLGQEFTVRKLHPQRGTRDDVSVWINLAQAQKLLGKPGRISAILALECNCASDRLDRIRSDVAAVLPDTQVIELASQALARAEARTRAASEAQAARARAAEEARAAMAAEHRARAELRQQHDAFAAILAPLVLLGCIVWLGLLTLNNVRERAGEIGILRALGLSCGRIFTLFLGRAAAVGLVGALLGLVLGVVGGALWAATLAEPADAGLFDPHLLPVLLAAPALCSLVAWLPALLAARQDPAVILREM